VHFLHYCSQHNTKTNVPKVFKLEIRNEMTLGYPTSGMVLGLKGQKSRLGLRLTAIQHGFELYECLLVPIKNSYSKQRE